MSNFSDMDNVFIMDHPLIQHKISILRNKETGTNEFRKLIEEIAVLMGFEALRDLPLEDVEVETPIETCRTPMISGKKLAVVPVLRAGLGMVNGITTLVPSAKIGHIGLYRDPVTHEPHEYYCKLPDPIDQRLIVMVDPMLATGGSAISAVNFIKQHGGKSIKCMFVIAAPEGLKRLHEVHPDVQIYVGHLDALISARDLAMQATEFLVLNRFLTRAYLKRLNSGNYLISRIQPFFARSCFFHLHLILYAKHGNIIKLRCLSHKSINIFFHFRQNF